MIKVNGKGRYILSVSAAFTEPDATAVGATLVKHLTGQKLAIVLSSRTDFVSYVEGGQANANIFYAVEDVAFVSPEKKTVDRIQKAKNKALPLSNAYQRSGVFTEFQDFGKTLDGRDMHVKNANQWDIAHGLVALNADPNDDEENPVLPYLPPTRDHKLALTGTFTWSRSAERGVPTVAVTGATEKDNYALQFYKGCKIKLNSDTQVDPWFIVTGIVRNSAGNYTLTCVNREQRVVPTGAGATSMLLQGSGVTIGLVGSGVPLVVGPAFLNPTLPGTMPIDDDEATYKANMPPGITLWNKDKAYVGSTENAGDVAANRRAPWDPDTVLSASESAKLGGFVGVNTTGGSSREKMVFDWYGVGSTLWPFFEDGDPIPCAQTDPDAYDVDWKNMTDAVSGDPVTGPVSVGLDDAARYLWLDVQDFSRFRSMPFSEEEATTAGLAKNIVTGPLDMVRLDKEPYPVMQEDGIRRGGFFQILATRTEGGQKQVKILVKPGYKTPNPDTNASYAHTDTSSFVHCGRAFSPAAHARVISYRASEPEDMNITGSGIATLTGLLRTLERCVADGVTYLCFMMGVTDAADWIFWDYTQQQLQRAIALVKKSMAQLADGGVVMFAGVGEGTGVNLDVELRGKDYFWPLDNPNAVAATTVGGRDFSCLDPKLSEYIPDPTKPVQSKLKNLARPFLHTHWWDVAWPESSPMNLGSLMYPYIVSSIGTMINVAVCWGGSDHRLLQVPKDASSGMAGSPCRGTYIYYMYDAAWDNPVGDRRVQYGPPETGLKFAHQADYYPGVQLSMLVAPAYEAYYKTHAGAFATGNTMVNRLYKSALKNVGPAVDDTFIYQPNQWDWPPPKTFYYPQPNSKTQTLYSDPNWNMDQVVDAWDADGSVNGQLTVVFDVGEVCHDTALEWSKAGRNKAMGNGLVSVKDFITEAVKP